MTELEVTHWHCIAFLEIIALHCIAGSHCIALLEVIALPCIALHCIALHCIALLKVIALHALLEMMAVNCVQLVCGLPLFGAKAALHVVSCPSHQIGDAGEYVPICRQSTGIAMPQAVSLALFVMCRGRKRQPTFAQCQSRHSRLHS